MRSIGLKLSGALLTTSLSISSGLASEITLITPSTIYTDESREKVKQILEKDVKKLQDGCADEFIESDDFYSTTIEECLENFLKGGYLDLKNYKIPFLGNGESKNEFTDFIERSWIEDILEAHDDIKEILKEDLTVIIDNLAIFEEIYSKQKNGNEIDEKHLRAYNLYTKFRENNFPFELLEGLSGMIIAHLLD